MYRRSNQQHNSVRKRRSFYGTVSALVATVFMVLFATSPAHAVHTKGLGDRTCAGNGYYAIIASEATGVDNGGDIKHQWYVGRFTDSDTWHSYTLAWRTTRTNDAEIQNASVTAGHVHDGYTGCRFH